MVIVFNSELQILCQYVVLELRIKSRVSEVEALPYFGQLGKKNI